MVRDTKPQEASQGGIYGDCEEESDSEEGQEGCCQEESSCQEESCWQEEEVVLVARSIQLSEAIH